VDEERYAPEDEAEMTFYQMMRLVEASARRPGNKAGLYPLGYGGIGLYPVGDNITHAADALYYLGIEDRKYKGQDGPPFTILHLKHDYKDTGQPQYDLPPGVIKYGAANLPPDTSTSQKRYMPD
jgi:hypothetical protein